MSLEAMTWALTRAPATDATKVLILLALANQAKSDGTAAWPSVRTIAEQARCSSRTVQRHLRELEAEGFLRPGDQHLVAHYRSDRRPTVYDLNLNLVAEGRGATDRRPALVTESERGDADDASGATKTTERGDAVTSPNPSFTRPSNPSARSDDLASATISLFPVAVPDPEPARPKQPRARDPLFDAIAEVCGQTLADLTPMAARVLGKVRRELVAAGATPDEVRVRAEVYRRKFRGADLTPLALAKHWPSLTPPPQPTRESWLEGYR